MKLRESIRSEGKIGKKIRGKRFGEVRYNVRRGSLACEFKSGKVGK